MCSQCTENEFIMERDNEEQIIGIFVLGWVTLVAFLLDLHPMV